MVSFSQNTCEKKRFYDKDIRKHMPGSDLHIDKIILTKLRISTKSLLCSSEI